jgi:hypothetical protein
VFSHSQWNCAFSVRRRRSKRTVIAVALAILASAISAALAGAVAQRSGAGAGDAQSVDTEDIFGFVEGADIGNAGNQELEADATLLAGKTTGTYGNTAAQFIYKYTAFENFRISAATTFASYDIAGVSGLSDLQSAVMQSLSLDARFRLLDRDQAPVGLTLSVQPHWGFVDETSGVPLNHIGWLALLLIDRELVPDRVVGGLNLFFDTDRTRLLAGHTVEQEPTPGIGAALAVKSADGLWLGGEVRYLRGYEGAALELFSGQALYAGPTLYKRVGKQGWVSVAVSAQVWGGAAGVPGALDLVNFTRYQALFRAGFEF